jgi:transposase
MIKRKDKDARDAEIYALSDQGMSLQSIADKLSIPISTVSMIVGHGRAFKLCKPLTPELKSRHSRESRLRFLEKYYAEKNDA